MEQEAGRQNHGSRMAQMGRQRQSGGRGAAEAGKQRRNGLGWAADAEYRRWGNRSGAANAEPWSPGPLSMENRSWGDTEWQRRSRGSKVTEATEELGYSSFDGAAKPRLQSRGGGAKELVF